MYTVSQKKKNNAPVVFWENFVKCGPILTLLYVQLKIKISRGSAATDLRWGDRRYSSF